MVTVFDPIQHEEEIYRFEEALHTTVAEDHGQPLRDFMEVGRIAGPANLPLELARQIGQHLEDKGHLTPSTNWRFRFTAAGWESYQQKRAARSPLTKKRERIEAVKGAAKAGGLAIGKWAWTAIVGIIAAAVSATAYREQIVRWLRSLLGL